MNVALVKETAVVVQAAEVTDGVTMVIWVPGGLSNGRHDDGDGGGSDGCDYGSDGGNTGLSNGRHNDDDGFGGSDYGSDGANTGLSNGSRSDYGGPGPQYRESEARLPEPDVLISD